MPSQSLPCQTQRQLGLLTRLGRRERNIRRPFTLPDGIVVSNLERYGTRDALRWAGTSSFTDYVHRLMDDGLTWESVDWLRSVTKLPILIKGILAPADAALAIDHGASGIVVSNHGGRQLDGSMATIAALPEIARVVNGRVPILLDGGVARHRCARRRAPGARAAWPRYPRPRGRRASWRRTVTEMLRSELELAIRWPAATTADITRLVKPA